MPFMSVRCNTNYTIMSYSPHFFNTFISSLNYVTHFSPIKTASSFDEEDSRAISEKYLYYESGV